MTCYKPVPSFRRREPNDFGKRPVIYGRQRSPRDLGAWEAIDLPCGGCIGCRQRNAVSWAVRILHEAKCHEQSSFITLTFDDEALRKRGHLSLDKRDWQLFAKRLRKQLAVRIKFFHCGEYGDTFGRPHYHACILGWAFEDKKRWRKSESGEQLYRSRLLERCWPYGFSSVGALTFSSAAYVARYTVKKQTGKLLTQESHKPGHRFAMSTATLCYRTGRPVPRLQEYATMSRGGRNGKGIGHEWFERHYPDWYRDDFVVVDGREVPIPRYYDAQYELLGHWDLEEIKARRLERAQEHEMDQTWARLAVREQVAQRKFGLYGRK